MDDLLLTANRLNLSNFRKKYPSNILNISRDKIFHRNTDSNDLMAYNSQNYTEYEVYDDKNYNQQIRQYQKLQDKVEKVAIDEYNKIFELSKRQIEKNIVDLESDVSIIGDPHRIKYTDTYSITPYATYMLTALSEPDGGHISSRFDDCFGTWNDGYKDDRNNKWHDVKEKHCKNVSPTNDPCKKYKQVYKIANPDYKGHSCRNEDDDKELEDGDRRHVHCNKEFCSESRKKHKKKKKTNKK